MGAEEVFYPQIDNSIPAISESEQAIVDEWWEGFSPIYRDRDADEMIRRIVGFMEEHPNLFLHLYLDEECLFELGAELAQSVAPWLERFSGERPKVKAAFRFIKDVRPDWEGPISRILPLVDETFLFGHRETS